MTRRTFVLLGILLIPIQVMAFQDNYSCKVKQVVRLNDAGNIVENIALSFLVGQSFVVNRMSGKLDGGNAWLQTSEHERVTVISDGRESNSFKSISVGKPPTSLATYLHIQLVNTDQIKPFYITTSMSIISGTCE